VSELEKEEKEREKKERRGLGRNSGKALQKHIIYIKLPINVPFCLHTGCQGSKKKEKGEKKEKGGKERKRERNTSMAMK